MSVLNDLAQQEGWISVHPPESTSDSQIGIYNGEPINVGAAKNTDGDECEVYQSGPYTIELRTSPDDGHRQVRVTREPLNKDHTTRLVATDDRHELTLPAPLVRETQIAGSDNVRLSVQWTETGLSVRVKQADESAEEPNVRSLQRRSSNGSTQYYIYFPQGVVAAFGLAPGVFDWETANEGLVAEITVVEVGEQTMKYTDVAMAGLADAPIDRESASGYQQTDIDDRTVAITWEGSGGQPSLVLRNPQAAAMGFTENREQIIEGKQDVCVLAEWTHSGPAIVIHSAPDALGYEWSDRGLRTRVQVNNWPDDGDGRGGHAGNQFKVYLPKDLLACLDEPAAYYWWPVKDRYYGSGALMLAGLPRIRVDEESLP